MSAEIDFSQDAEKIFKAFLLKGLSLANFYIYVSNDEARGLNVLDGLIDSTNAEFKKALEKEHKDIVHGAYGKRRVDVRALYSSVADALFKTYLSEINTATIPTSVLKKDRDAPAEAIPERLSANL